MKRLFMHYLNHSLRWLALMFSGVACVACGTQAASAPVPTPSPTIAAIIIPATPVLSPTPPPQPTSVPPAAAPTNTPPHAATTLTPEPTIYLWPSYLPTGMQPAPEESRVSGENELGDNDLGFYLITLNGNGNKLAIGGGGLQDVLPLTGDMRPIQAGTRKGTLITNSDQREVVLDVARGKLFVYSKGLAEEELLRVAASLQPIDVHTLRALAAPK